MASREKDALRARLITFAVHVLDLCENLPLTLAGRHIAGELIRLSTTAAPRFSEANGVATGQQATQKLGLALSALDESSIWFEILHERQMAPETELKAVTEECLALCRDVATQQKEKR